MGEQQIPHLEHFTRELSEKKIGRRDFVRLAALMGLGVPAAYALAGKITGQDFAPPAKAQAALPKGGVLRIGTRIKDIKSPHSYSWGGYDSNISRQVCEFLTFTDVNGVTGGALFESWTVSQDLKTWDFKVKKGVKWSSGEELVADHIIWNIKRWLDAATGSSMIGLQKGYMLTEKPGPNGKPTTELWDANAVEKVDSHTVRFNCKVPQVAVPEHLFHYAASILHPDDKGVFGVGAKGTGAFTLTEFELGKKAVLKRRPGYWGGDAALDGIEFIDLGDDASAAIAALGSKQIHGLYQGDPSQYDALKAMSHLEFYTAKTATTGVMRMRPDAKPFDDPRVRKAMRLAIEPDTVLKVALRGLGTLGGHHHNSEAHPDFGGTPPMKRDVAAAKKLLADAGHPNGIKSEIVVPNDHPWFLPMAEACQQMWKEVGIDIAIKPIPGAQYWDVWTKVPLGITIWFHRPLAVMVMGLAYRSGVPWNESGYSNKTFDEVLLKAEGELDIVKRKAFMKELETLLQEDGPLVQPVFLNVFTFMDKRVKGFSQHPTQYFFGTKIGLEA